MFPIVLVDFANSQTSLQPAELECRVPGCSQPCRQRKLVQPQGKKIEAAGRKIEAGARHMWENWKPVQHRH
jgi:hypothetical protein